MIAADTNILVRFFVEDDAPQHGLAKSLMNDRTADDPLFVGVVVIVELVWVLRRTYGYGTAQALAVVTLLLASGNVLIENERLIRNALDHATTANADLADCIIAGLAQQEGSTITMTFDRIAARRVPGMALLK